MLVGHHHAPGVFDADHCWACARQAALHGVLAKGRDPGLELLSVRRIGPDR